MRRNKRLKAVVSSEHFQQHSFWTANARSVIDALICSLCSPRRSRTLIFWCLQRPEQFTKTKQNAFRGFNAAIGAAPALLFSSSSFLFLWNAQRVHRFVQPAGACAPERTKSSRASPLSQQRRSGESRGSRMRSLMAPGEHVSIVFRLNTNSWTPRSRTQPL